ncbi:MAG: GyrI-like domain-containing protein [Taibaiella sp.]|nr:GyrI-like domain-containing protein [Taibaiella sp.]
MEKLNLSKLYKAYYTAKTQPELVETEQAQYLSITGQGDPSGEDFASNVGALYAVAYTIKFMCKAEDKDFVVAKLEGLWWFDEALYANLSIAETQAKVPRGQWSYRLLIRMPEYVTDVQVKAAARAVLQKKGIALAGETELFMMPAGKAVQMLHTGPYANEPETLALIKAFSDDHGFKRNGPHHEIYLSDVNKTAPEKLRTILREPVI